MVCTARILDVCTLGHGWFSVCTWRVTDWPLVGSDGSIQIARESSLTTHLPSTLGKLMLTELWASDKLLDEIASAGVGPASKQPQYVPDCCRQRRLAHIVAEGLAPTFAEQAQGLKDLAANRVPCEMG